MEEFNQCFTSLFSIHFTETTEDDDDDDSDDDDSDDDML
jgi:hypothetical protein